MDIARSPSASPDPANPNPQLADAPPEPKAPPVILRADYKPYPWRVPAVSLDFELGAEQDAGDGNAEASNPTPMPNRAIRCS